MKLQKFFFFLSFSMTEGELVQKSNFPFHFPSDVNRHRLFTACVNTNSSVNKNRMDGACTPDKAACPPERAPIRVKSALGGVAQAEIGALPWADPCPGPGSRRGSEMLAAVGLEARFDTARPSRESHHLMTSL